MLHCPCLPDPIPGPILLILCPLPTLYISTVKPVTSSSLELVGPQTRDGTKQWETVKLDIRWLGDQSGPASISHRNLRKSFHLSVCQFLCDKFERTKLDISQDLVKD